MTRKVLGAPDPLVCHILASLQNNAYEEALFTAERLFAEVPGSENLFLLSNCFYRMGRPKQATRLLEEKGASTPKLRFLHAKCCFEINKMKEAETSIVGSIFKPKTLEEISIEFGDQASFVLLLLGDIYRRTDRAKKAIECYRKVLHLNPLMWTAYELLCSMGVQLDVTSVFHAPSGSESYVSRMIDGSNENNNPSFDLQPSENVSASLPSQGIDTLSLRCEGFESGEMVTPDTSALCMPTTAPKLAPQHDGPRLSMRKTGRNLFNVTPPVSLKFGLSPQFGFNSTLEDPESSLLFSVPSASTPSAPSPQETVGDVGTRKLRSRQRSNASNAVPTSPNLESPTGPGSVSVASTPIVPVSNSMGVGNGAVRPSRTSQGVLQTGNRYDPPILRSQRNLQSAMSPPSNTSRLLGAKENTTGPRTRAQTAKAAAQRRSRVRDKKEDDEKESNISLTNKGNVGEPWRQSLEGYLQLLQKLGKVYQCLADYQCSAALDAVLQVPEKHYFTGTVLSWVGRCHLELASYPIAFRTFYELRQLEPWQLRGMEYYSTVLWYLQKDMTLSSLASDLLELDRNAPEPWCAAGNCFSLQREHETAIRYFHRALQVDQHFSYAYTLLGHEHTTVEELEKALTAFRHAIRCDSRLHNAWFGLSDVYFRQEKFSLAEMHLDRALRIYPQSAILLAHLGVIRSRLGKVEGHGGALECLREACRRAPTNPVCKYHHASVLFGQEKYQEALKELEELKQLAPKECMVYFMLGRVQKRLGNHHRAMIYFSWAMDLDPKGANSQLKVMLEHRNPAVDALMDTHVEESQMEDSQAEGLGGGLSDVEQIPDHSPDSPDSDASIGSM